MQTVLVNAQLFVLIQLAQDGSVQVIALQL
jgi:hypothetical protein